MRKFSGQKLRKCREKAKFSRQKLCEAIGFIIGPQTIVRYEAGNGSPSLDAAAAIANALGCSLKDLTDES